MIHALRITQTIDSDNLTIALPADFPRGIIAEVIVLTLEQQERQTITTPVTNRLDQLVPHPEAFIGNLDDIDRISAWDENRWEAQWEKP